MTIKISKNKRIIIESQLDHHRPFSDYWFSFTTAFSRKVDNAGFDIFLELGKFYFRFSINDKRFWDYEKDTWLEPCKYEQTNIKYEWF